MKKILITGAGGYIGSISTYLFLQNGYEVIGLDNLARGYMDPIDYFSNKFTDKFRFYKADLINDDLDEILKSESGISAVLHYAGYCIVNESMEHPEWFFDNNVYGTSKVLQCMVNKNIPNIIFSSTSTVYGDPQYMPVDESHPLGSVNPYGESKRMAESVIRWYSDLKNIRYMILRYFNVCGASDDGQIGDSKKPSTLLVQNTVRGALGIEPFYLTCPEVQTKDKTPIRDYINVVDLNLAHIKAFEYLDAGGKSDIVNLGTGSGNSVLEIVNAVQKITGKQFPVQKGEARKGEHAAMYTKIDKAKEILGWSPTHSIEDSVKSLVLWYTSHPNGWEK